MTSDTLARAGCVVAALVAAVPGGLPSPAQSPRDKPVAIVPRARPDRSAKLPSNMRVDVRMVLVPVTVTDPWDRPVNGLAAKSFELFEDGVPQKIVSLFREEGPVSVGFVFDASNSMRNRMDVSRKAIDQFLKETAPGDEFFLIRFSDKASLVQRFTEDPAAILSALSMVRPDGWTALIDATYMGVQRMRRARHSRRALFVLTDGSDNNSRYTESELVNLIREVDVRIFAIGLFERPRLLDRIAAETGGRAYFARKLKDLPEMVDRLSRELRSQYVLGYYSTNRENDGRYRKVSVELASAPPQGSPQAMNVKWRRGYYAPLD
jgi:VWFA-related protein